MGPTGAAPAVALRRPATHGEVAPPWSVVPAPASSALAHPHWAVLHREDVDDEEYGVETPAAQAALEFGFGAGAGGAAERPHADVLLARSASVGYIEPDRASRRPATSALRAPGAASGVRRPFTTSRDRGTGRRVAFAPNARDAMRSVRTAGGQRVRTASSLPALSGPAGGGAFASAGSFLEMPALTEAGLPTADAMLPSAGYVRAGSAGLGSHPLAASPEGLALDPGFALGLADPAPASASTRLQQECESLSLRLQSLEAALHGQEAPASASTSPTTQASATVTAAGAGHRASEAGVGGLGGGDGGGGVEGDTAEWLRKHRKADTVIPDLAYRFRQIHGIMGRLTTVYEDRVAVEERRNKCATELAARVRGWLVSRRFARYRAARRRWTMRASNLLLGALRAFQNRQRGADCRRTRCAPRCPSPRSPRLARAAADRRRS